jgi:WD40 repeat protein
MCRDWGNVLRHGATAPLPRGGRPLPRRYGYLRMCGVRVSAASTKRVLLQLGALRRREHPAKAYDAFISYSHAADEDLAAALQRALQRFARPLHRLRALRIFRDDENLAASPDLGHEIADALSQSEFLILLASPQAAASPWVALELEWWIANRAVDRVLICLTAGTIRWDASRGDFDWRRTTALPRVLSGAFHAEPRYARLDGLSRASSMLSLDNASFREAVRDLASPIHGLPKDALESEDVLQRRRTTRIARIGACAVALLAVLSLLGAWVATRERDAARRQAQIARSRSLAASAMALRDDDPDRGRRLALEAVRASRTPEAAAAFAATTFRAGLQRQIGSRGSAKTIAVHPQAGLVATADRSGIQIRDATSGRVLWRLRRRLAWNRIRDAAFSADATHLVALGPYGEVALWNLRDGNRVADFRVADEPETVAISPDGSRVITVGADRRHAAMWQAETGELVRDLGQGGYRTIQFSPNGKLVALADLVRPRVVVLTVAGGRRIAQIDASVAGVAGAGANDVAFTPDGRYLAVAFDFGIGVWSGPRFKHVQELTAFSSLTDGFFTVDFSADGRFLIAGGEDRIARIWKWPSGRLASVLRGHGGPILEAVIDRADRFAATASEDGTARLWSLASGATLATYRVGQANVTRVWLDRDGRHLLTVGIDDVTRVWRVPVILLRGHVGSVRAAIFTEDDRSVISAGDDGTGRLWDLQNRHQVGQVGPYAEDEFGPPPEFDEIAESTDSRIVLLSGANTEPVAWDLTSDTSSRPRAPRRLVGNAVISPDGRFVSVLDFNDALYIWRTSDGTIVRTFTLARPRNGVAEIRLGPRGDVLAADPTGSTLTVWDWNRARLIRSLPAAEGGFARSSFDPTGTLLAVAEWESASSRRGYGWRGFVRVWDWRTGRLERTLEAGAAEVVNHPPTFDATGDKLLVISGNAVYVWETKTGRFVARLVGHAGLINAARFSADGRYVITAGADSTSRVFDLATASEIIVLRDHHGQVTDARFSPHEHWLLTAGGDGEIHVYDCNFCASREPRRGHARATGG